jgi:hypothetical protein
LVHAADDRSVMESLQSLPSVAASVRAIAAGKPYVVGPSAIGLRDNPYGPSPLPNPDGVRRAMSGADPRQRGLFNAAWSLGYVARFAVGGASRVALSAPVGAFGIADGDVPYPVFSVIQGCAVLRGATVHGSATTCEEAVLALLAAFPDRWELWIANLTAEAREVLLPQPFRDAALSRLDVETAAGGFESSTARPAGGVVRLDSYAVLRCRAARV